LLLLCQEAQQVRVEMFAPNWILTIFVYQFPLPLVLHVWDIFLYEGPEIVLRVALSVLKLSKERLLKMEFEDILQFLRYLPEDVLDSNRLVLCALNVKLDDAHLAKFIATYHQVS
jgi:hypothetical protein